MPPPLVDRSIALEHLRRLNTFHPQRVLSRTIGVSQQMISHIIAGRREMSDSFLERFLAVYPLSEAQATAGTANARASSGDEEDLWLVTEKRETLESFGLAESALLQLDELDWLLLHPQYQPIRDYLLLQFPGLLQTILLHPPEDGPSRVISDTRERLAQAIEASTERESSIECDSKGKRALAHSQFRETQRNRLRKLDRQATPKDLLKSMAWKALVRSLVANVRLLTDLRIEAAEHLRELDTELSLDLALALDRARAISFPCTQYQSDPVGFVKTILGKKPWPGQVRMLEAIRDHKRVVAPTGQGTGKTKCVSWVGLWRYSCWDDGCVCLSNFTGDQLRTQDWREIQAEFSDSGICLSCREDGVTQRPCPHSQCLDGKISESPRGGLWSEDRKRFIVGITGDEPTALGGYHGIHLMVICDEFSGLKQELYDAWRGNTAGAGNKFFGPGNPLGNSGPMYEAVMIERVQQAFGWVVVSLSTEEAAATGEDWAPDPSELKALELSDDRGKENPIYMIRVLGKYPTLDELSIYQTSDVIRAQQRDHYNNTQAVGKLIISCDPCREEGLGDQAVFAVTRGKKVLEFLKGRGWSWDEYLDILVELYQKHKTQDGEQAIFACDADGPGQSVIRRVDDYLHSHRVPESQKARVEVIPVYLGQQANEFLKYDMIGDEAHAYLANWLRHGGAFPTDSKLEQEMSYSKWTPVRRKRNEREVEVLSATRKDGPNGFRKLIHRSPDTLDSLRIMAACSFHQGVLAVPDPVSPEAKQDQESLEDLVPMDETQAFNNYLTSLRRGSYG